jgi:hypothetical protein
MWPTSYADRLLHWNLLRSQCRTLSVDQALLAINDWWYAAPVTARTIIWEYHPEWPDPWQLLAHKDLCDLARGLAMLYTVRMTEHPAVSDVILAQTDHDNLVLVNQGKYILNWSSGQLLNIQSQAVQIRRSLDSAIFNDVLR